MRRRSCVADIRKRRVSGRLARIALASSSAEREDPGNRRYDTAKIWKIVGADDEHARILAAKLYGSFIEQVVLVSSAATAEAIKLTENIFRAVNIALVNELKVIFTAMGIDIWEVIVGAQTKPFGSMPFYPGLGLGGHCIPIDPFYLTWRAWRIRDLDALHRARRRYTNKSMPLHRRDCPPRPSTFASKRKDFPVSASRPWGSPTRGTSTTCRSFRRLRSIELLEVRGAKETDTWIPTSRAYRSRANMPVSRGESRDCAVRYRGRAILYRC